jgi:hypothetical protein
MVSEPEIPLSQFRAIELTEKDAHLVPPLLGRVFGYTYFSQELYETAGVISALRSGANIFFISINAAGDACGLLAMRFSFPTRAIVELGTLCIDPALQPAASGHVLRLMTDALTARVAGLTRGEGLQGLISTEVTIHRLTQRLVQQFGFVSTGIFLGWTPAWAERLRVAPNDRSAPARRRKHRMLRRTETVSARPFHKRLIPSQVALPHRYAGPLRTIYSALKMPVSFVAPGAVPAESLWSEMVDIRRGRAVVECRHIGRDAAAFALQRLGHYRDRLIDLIHFVVPLGPIASDALVEALVEAGCTYAALVPLYRHHDALVLQYLNDVAIELSEDDLHSPLAKMLYREAVPVPPGHPSGRRK